DESRKDRPAAAPRSPPARRRGTTQRCQAPKASASASSPILVESTRPYVVFHRSDTEARSSRALIVPVATSTATEASASRLKRGTNWRRRAVRSPGGSADQAEAPRRTRAASPPTQTDTAVRW